MAKRPREVHANVRLTVRGYMGGDVRALHPAADAVLAGAHKALHDYATANMGPDELCTFDWSVQLSVPRIKKAKRERPR